MKEGAIGFETTSRMCLPKTWYGLTAFLKREDNEKDKIIA